MGCLPVYTVGPKEVMLSGSYVSGTVPLSYYPCQTVTGGLGSRGGMLHSWQLLQLPRPSKAQSQSLLCSWQSSEPKLALVLALGLTHYVYC